MNTDTTLVDVAVKDLSGGALDWAVGTAERLPLALTPPNYGEGVSLVYIVDTDPLYRPSTDWSQGGPLIDKYNPEENAIASGGRYAEVWVEVGGGVSRVGRGIGETRLVAACRAIVANNLGHIVKVPACLVMP